MTSLISDLQRRRLEGHAFYDILLQVSNQHPIADVLAAAQAKGVPHGDLRPSAVLLAEDFETGTIEDLGRVRGAGNLLDQLAGLMDGRHHGREQGAGAFGQADGTLRFAAAVLGVDTRPVALAVDVAGEEHAAAA